MGSPCSIHLYDADPQRAQQKFRSIQQLIEGLEARYSRYRTGNLMSSINAVAARGDSMTVDDEVLALLHYANTCYEQSDGLFDITSGVLREAWDFSRPDAVVLPAEEQLKSLLQRVGWRHVIVEGHELRFTRPGMALDFGGIVKEYAADLAASQLQAMGAESAVVELGGDIRAVGPRISGAPWNIKIRDPRHAGEHIAEIALYQEGIATSGDYERFVMIGGKRYAHILSPVTGWPVQGLASVTVVAPQTVVAGSAATIAMLKGTEGRDWLQTLGVEFYAIDG